MLPCPDMKKARRADLEGKMKALVGAACVAVIALAIYIIGGDFLQSRESARREYAAVCDQTLERAKATDPNSISSAEKKRISQGLLDCSTFMRTGKMP